MTQDLLLYGGSIHTMDARRPIVEALFIRGNRILAIGSAAEILAADHGHAKRVDLGGRTAFPGFEDAHVHACSHGLALRRVDLTDAQTLQESLALVRGAAAQTRQGAWLQGRGWNHNAWPKPARPTCHDLDCVAPHVPVALSSKDGHSLWANSAALRIAGVVGSTPDPPGGEILRQASGEPTGILTERAQELVTRHVPQPDAEATLDAARAAAASASRLGVTSFHNCEGPDSLAAFQRLAAGGELVARVWHMIPLGDLASALSMGLRTGFGNDMLRLGHVKMFADGALGSCTAEMLAPYDDRPDDSGVRVTSSGDLYEAVSAAARGGLASAVHAIGDAACRRVLDVYERVAQEGITGDLRQRIEHVQILSPADVPRLAQLRVLASMQPIHATQDMDMADLHWGSRARWGYAWRSVLDSGAVLAFGTDCPIESLDPLAGLYAAVTRRRPGRPPGREWYPEEKLTLDEAVYAYTMGSAMASGEEEQKGSLTPGKLADVVILSRDVYAGPPEVLLDTVVDTTILGGRVIFERE